MSRDPAKPTRPEEADERIPTGTTAATKISASVGVIAAMVLALLVNILVSRHYRRWDWTRGGLYTLSDATTQTLRGIEEPIHVYVLLSEGDPLAVAVRHLLEAYRGETTRLDVEFVDPDRRAAEFIAVQQRFGIVAGKSEDGKIVADAAIVVARGDVPHFITTRDLVQLDEDDENRRRPRIEQALTSAIRAVLSQERPRACFVMGHGEGSVAAGAGPGAGGLGPFRESLIKNNFEVVDEGADDALEACRLLVIAGPTEKVPAAEVKRFISYADQGGSLLVALGPELDAERERAKNRGLGDLLARFGVASNDDFVFELDPPPAHGPGLRRVVHRPGADPPRHRGAAQGRRSRRRGGDHPGQLAQRHRRGRGGPRAAARHQRSGLRDGRLLHLVEDPHPAGPRARRSQGPAHHGLRLRAAEAAGIEPRARRPPRGDRIVELTLGRQLAGRGAPRQLALRRQRRRLAHGAAAAPRHPREADLHRRPPRQRRLARLHVPLRGPLHPAGLGDARDGRVPAPPRHRAPRPAPRARRTRAHDHPQRGQAQEPQEGQEEQQMKVAKHATTLVLTALAMVAGASVLWLDRDRVTTTEAEARKKNLFRAYRPDDITELNITAEGKKARLYRGDLDDAGQRAWQIEIDGGRYPADERARISSSAPWRWAPPSAGSPRTPWTSAPSASPPSASPSPWPWAGSRSASASAARRPRPKGAATAEIEGRGVAVITRELAAALEIDPTSLRSRTLLPFAEGEVQSLSIRPSDGPPLDVTRAEGAGSNRGAGFRVDGPAPQGSARVAAAAMEKIWGTIGALEADAYLERAAAEKAFSRRATLTLTFRDAARKRAVLELGGACPGHPDDVVALRVEPEPAAACVASGLVDDLLVPAAGLADHHLVGAPADQVTEVKITSAGRTLELARSGPQWHLRAPEDRSVDADAGRAFLDALLAVEGDTFAPRDLRSAPRATVRVISIVPTANANANANADSGSDDERVETLEVFADQDGLVPVRRSEDGAVLLVPRDRAATLFPDVAALRSRKLFDEPLASVRSLRVEANGRVQRFSRDTSGSFTLLEPRGEGLAADGVLAADVASLLGGLSVDRWIGADTGAYGLDKPRLVLEAELDGGKDGGPRARSASPSAPPPPQAPSRAPATIPPSSSPRARWKKPRIAGSSTARPPPSPRDRGPRHPHRRRRQAPRDRAQRRRPAHRRPPRRPRRLRPRRVLSATPSASSPPKERCRWAPPRKPRASTNPPRHPRGARRRRDPRQGPSGAPPLRSHGLAPRRLRGLRAARRRGGDVGSRARQGAPAPRRPPGKVARAGGLRGGAPYCRRAKAPQRDRASHGRAGPRKPRRMARSSAGSSRCSGSSRSSTA